MRSFPILLLTVTTAALAMLAIACDDESAAPDASPTVAATPASAAALCAGAAAEAQAPAVASPDLIEISGIASSRTQDVIWAHNDSGDRARVFAIGSAGETLAVYDIGGAEAFDWEDMAVGPGPDAGADYLYIGDIGDNASARAGIVVYRVAEPKVDPASSDLLLEGAAALRLAYPDGPHDAETLLADPASGDLYIVTKDIGGGPSGVYRAAAPHDATAPIALERVAKIDWSLLDIAKTLPLDAPPLPRALGGVPTGGDITADGRMIAVRTYATVWLWQRAEGQTIAEALAGAPCEAPSALEPQGEAIAFTRDGRGYLTASEGVNPPLHRFALP